LTKPKEMCVRIGLGGVLGPNTVGGQGQTRAGQSKGYADGAAAKKCEGAMLVLQASKLLQIIHSPVCDQSGALVQIDTAGFRMERRGLATEALKAFLQLREEIASRPVMAYPNATGQYHLFVDAALGDENNSWGLGAVLMQDQVGGLRKPVAYASRRLDKHKQNYPVFLAEMQAAVFGME
jgi:uncharacterized protein YbaR (Trm112 family)